jgi:hypothetical protein
MKGIFEATWGTNKVEFTLYEVQEMAGAYISVKNTGSNHSVNITEEIEDNDDREAVLNLIKAYCANKNIELAPQFNDKKLKIS